MSSSDQNNVSTRKPVRFEIKRETLQELGIQELDRVAGGAATSSCCIGCRTLQGQTCQTDVAL